MAETQAKRQRDETLIVEEDLEEDPKRRKSYNQILSFLDEEDQDDSNQDVSSIFTTLQRELSFDSDPITQPDKLLQPDNQDIGAAKEDEDRLLKRLLEATDDELGLPTGPVTGQNNDDHDDGLLVMDGGDDEFGLMSSSCGGGGGLWELEDEAANYYTWFQSELFM
ncbi:uncharacterized protein LOC124926861 [Impatiens glandulifera]|uniref:uncharacterized protein LOC124926861 n=1 Tax=Impatiens glandulifera TaxID=253017 RepID=UPI001FB09CF1|nr:uncharacterized protein LOC124926861 [Impatiens glandulifera]